MKIHAILGKKQILLSSLLVILGVAVYLNWQFANVDDGFAVSGTLTSDTTSTKNYGDAKLVDTQTEAESDSDDYFSKARLTRSKSRSEAEATINKILNNSSVGSDEKQAAAAQVVQITKTTTDEAKMENLIKAKGFDDCVVYLEDKAANVIVKTDGLKSEQAAQIKDIVVSNANVAAENIRIVEVK